MNQQELVDAIARSLFVRDGTHCPYWDWSSAPSDVRYQYEQSAQAMVMQLTACNALGMFEQVARASYEASGQGSWDALNDVVMRSYSWDHAVVAFLEWVRLLAGYER